MTQMDDDSEPRRPSLRTTLRDYWEAVQLIVLMSFDGVRDFIEG